MKPNNDTPSIRFAGFTDAWEQRKIGDFAKVLSAARVHKHEWTEQGVPFFRSSDVMRVHNGRENEKVYISQELFEDLSMVSGRPEKGDIFITGGGSIGMPYIVPNDNPLYSKDADLLWIKKSENHNSQYLYSYFFTPTFRNYIASISHIGTIAHYTIVQVKETPVLLPKIREQEKIGSFFSNLDRIITLHQRKYDQLVNIKKSMLEKMFPKNGEMVPEVRFAGFTDAWEQRKLGEVAPLRGGYAFQSSHFKCEGIPIVKISNILQNGEVGGDFDYYDEISSDENFTLPDGAAVLAMSGATTGKVSILSNKEKKKIYQNQRVGYFSPCENIAYSFIQTITRSHLFTEQLKSVLVAGAQPNVSSKDIDNFEFYFPTSIFEQSRIGAFITEIDSLITLHQRKLERLQNIKKACLEKMFV